MTDPKQRFPRPTVSSSFLQLSGVKTMKAYLRRGPLSNHILARSKSLDSMVPLTPSSCRPNPPLKSSSTKIVTSSAVSTAKTLGSWVATTLPRVECFVCRSTGASVKAAPTKKKSRTSSREKVSYSCTTRSGLISATSKRSQSYKRVSSFGSL